MYVWRVGRVREPVELMLMSEHSARRERNRPGLYFGFCVASRPRGAAAFLLCVHFIIKVFECSSLTYELCYTIFD